MSCDPLWQCGRLQAPRHCCWSRTFSAAHIKCSFASALHMPRAEAPSWLASPGQRTSSGGQRCWGFALRRSAQSRFCDPATLKVSFSAVRLAQAEIAEVTRGCRALAGKFAHTGLSLGCHVFEWSLLKGGFRQRRLVRVGWLVGLNLIA